MQPTPDPTHAHETPPAADPVTPPTSGTEPTQPRDPVGHRIDAYAALDDALIAYATHAHPGDAGYEAVQSAITAHAASVEPERVYALMCLVLDLMKKPEPVEAAEDRYRGNLLPLIQGERYSPSRNPPPSAPEIDAFLADILAVCLIHGLSLDGDGSDLQVRLYSGAYDTRLAQAHDCR